MDLSFIRLYELAQELDLRPRRDRRARFDNVQRLVIDGCDALPRARYALLHFARPELSDQWLPALASQVTYAAGPAPLRGLTLAFTHAGLARLGLPDTTLSGFSAPFVEGMTDPFRRRILGDDGANAPERWKWGAPNQPAVHGMVAFYGTNEPEIEAWFAREKAQLERAGCEIVAVVDGGWLRDQKEHFGFRSGIAQPELSGPGWRVGEGTSSPGTADNRVASGEFVLGYLNEYGETPASPHVADSDDPQQILGRASRSGFRDFGRDGSYLVVRQLRQDVAGFWRSAEVFSASVGMSPVRFAAKLIGRWPSGAPLVLAPHRDRPELGAVDDFGYAVSDPHGYHCPIGAHIRRASPRDWLLSTDPDRSTRLANKHRILRRSRPYGAPLDPSMDVERLMRAEDDGIERGLFFMALNADIARQFELVQQSWLNNPKFGGLTNETDPLLGQSHPEAGFTIQRSPLAAHCPGLRAFVELRGGGYFFLPSRQALHFLSQRALGAKRRAHATTNPVQSGGHP